MQKRKQIPPKKKRAKKRPSRPADDTRRFLEMAAMPSDKQLGVVLRFLREDLDALGAPEHVAWSSRLKALALRPLVSGRLAVQFQAVSSYEALPVKSLQTIQEAIGSGIRQAITPIKGGRIAHVWRLPNLLGGGMFRAFEGDGYIWKWTVPGEDWPIILGAARLVAEHADRVRICKRCEALFLAVKRQEYCTPEHGQQARDQRKAGRKMGGAR